ncbi:H+-or Na+-translocating f-type, v-type and A-type ATPase superfamily [Micromonas pusilla CCMP1545]|uniref:H+-or Na+-translocating f-type, v-type and A-type ATPase superfamily n=1 Tax=Micromonas pusilla (strain CCMP1545) TaxID=564608 RepID=C1MQS2_MICPC|nr:H+-or Na+-translocating f-type, v-type and A-type ATPase superfamily [Micromonas pusilla CCMP1545]EEH58128.1 H+-or Na+-translocating f-type, v-type and A-type ATPase superfamily [Micromonas pusilla CCMP1545]|eukprot:XP_003058177.1 H+-or Na+-translocating f-type, v-type and A-type ATPase superfamily [Micromonas pusilla CCMP1545]
MGLALGTVLFLALEAAFALFVNARWRAHDRGLKHVLFAASVFCCWLMWAIVYASQMHPLIRPVISREG